MLCAVAVAGCGGDATIDQIETDVLAGLTEEPPQDVQGTVLDVDCDDYTNPEKPKEGTRLNCGAFNVDKNAHEPEEQIGEVDVTVGDESAYTFKPCTATASGRGPKC